jgi:hypothetical protein
MQKDLWLVESYKNEVLASFKQEQQTTKETQSSRQQGKSETKKLYKIAFIDNLV